MKPTIVTLTGPSCAGKSTLERMLQKVGMVPLISTTTREPRSGEVDGVHYNFISKEEFTNLREQGGLVEDITFGEHFYGLARKDVDFVAAQNKPAVVVVEPKGRNQILTFGQKLDWNIYTVFVDNPAQVIAERFVGRICMDAYNAGLSKSESLAFSNVYAKRLAIMMEEEQRWRDEAYEGRMGFFPYDIVFHEFNRKNEENAVKTICHIVSQSKWTEKVA